MNNYKLRLPLVLQYLLVSGLVVACGGGGSGSGAGGSGAASVASPGVGSGGTGISIGPITGFGSIIVNQVRYNIDGVTPSIKDATELKLGMVVQVTNAPGASTGPTGVATAVKTAAELRGELEGIVVDPAIFLSTLVVQGVSVSVDKATVYDGFISLNALSRGNFLQVYGLPQGGGGLRATRIEKISTTAQLIATGSVTNLNTSSSSFKIGSLAVNFGTSAFSGISASALANGVVLRVRGSFSAGNFIAATIEPWLDAIPNNTKISLEGLVSGYSPTAKTFTLGDVTVDISAAVFAGGDAGSLNDGDKVELVGNFAKGVLYATNVQIRQQSGNNNNNANEPFSVTGTITQFSSPSNFQVKGQAIDASQPGVVFINGTAANLAINVLVSVIGVDVVDGVLVATQVTF